MIEPNDKIINELTPRPLEGAIFAVKREKKCFDFPVHTHKEWEINLIVGCKGALRIVGDSAIELDNLDLVMIGTGLEHGWLQHNCTNKCIKELTIQFPDGFFEIEYLKANSLTKMHDLILTGMNGISFSNETVLETYGKMKELTTEKDPYEKMMKLIDLVRSLSEAEDYSALATDSFSGLKPRAASQRISKVLNYINSNYGLPIRLDELAGLINMTSSAFARFFKERTGRTAGEYVMEVRIGAAIRQLVNTEKSISEICFESGFSNLSHFSRSFRKIKGYSPSDFRQLYALYRK